MVDKEVLSEYFKKLDSSMFKSRIYGYGGFFSALILGDLYYRNMHKGLWEYHLFWPIVIGLSFKVIKESNEMKNVYDAYKIIHKKVKNENARKELERYMYKTKNPFLKSLTEVRIDFLDNKVDKAFEKTKIILDVIQESKLNFSWINKFINFINYNLVTKLIPSKEDEAVSALYYMGFNEKKKAAKILKKISNKSLDNRILEAYGRYCMGYDSDEEWKDVLDNIDQKKFRKIANSTYEVLEYMSSNFSDLLIFKRDGVEGIKRGYEENILLYDILKEYARDKKKDESFVNLTKSIACLEHDKHVYHINKRQDKICLNNFDKLNKEQINLALDGLARIHASFLDSSKALIRENRMCYLNGEPRLDIPVYEYRIEFKRRFLDRFNEIEKSKILNRVEDVFRTVENSKLGTINHGDPYLSNCLDGIWIDTRLCFRDPCMDVVGVTEDPRVIKWDTQFLWEKSINEYTNKEYHLNDMEHFALLNDIMQIGSKVNQRNYEEAKHYMIRVMMLEERLKLGIGDIIYDKCKSKLASN